MTHKKHLARQALAAAADALSDEIWEGKWNHIPELRTKPIGKYGEIIEIMRELERLCPGHSQEEYQDAIARSLGKH